MEGGGGAMGRREGRRPRGRNEVQFREGGTEEGTIASNGRGSQEGRNLMEEG